MSVDQEPIIDKKKPSKLRRLLTWGGGALAAGGLATGVIAANSTDAKTQPEIVPTDSNGVHETIGATPTPDVPGVNIPSPDSSEKPVATQEALSTSSFEIPAGLSADDFAKAYADRLDTMLNADANKGITDIVLANLDKTNEQIYDMLAERYTGMFTDALLAEDWQQNVDMSNYITNISEAYQVGLNEAFLNRDGTIVNYDNKVVSSTEVPRTDGLREIHVSLEVMMFTGKNALTTTSFVIDESSGMSKIVSIKTLSSTQE